MNNPKPEAEDRRRSIGAVAEDATGFGVGELRMTRDLIVDPRAVALAQGCLASPYPRSLRYFLTLNGAYILILSLLGGFNGQLGSALPPEGLAVAIEISGKSRDAFLGDLDQWYSLIVSPIVGLCFYFPLSFLFRRWTGNRDAGTGQAFAYVSGWSLYGAVFGIIGLFVPAFQQAALVIALMILAVLFFRMGRGIWWSSAGQAIRRFVMLCVGIAIAYVPAVIIIAIIAFLGALYAP